MTYNRAASRTGLGRRHPVQLAAAAVGGVFLLVGILGFVPGVTTNYDQLSFAGHESGALLLGVFAVSVLHNLVHAAFGVAGLVLSRTRSGAKNYLVVGGIVYAVLWLYGLPWRRPGGGSRANRRAVPSGRSAWTKTPRNSTRCRRPRRTPGWRPRT